MLRGLALSLFALRTSHLLLLIGGWLWHKEKVESERDRRWDRE